MNRKDTGGECWDIVVGAAVGGIIGGVSSAINSYITNGEVSVRDVVSGTLTGAVTGAISTSPLFGRGTAIILNTLVAGFSSWISGDSLGGIALSASTAAITTLITSPVNGWFKETPNTFNSAITKGAANFITDVHVEGIVTTGRVAFKGVTSSNVNTNTTVNGSINAVIVGGSGKFTSTMMKW